METEEGYHRALKIKETKRFLKKDYSHYFMDEPLAFTPAPEPSDIIWENKYVSLKQRFWRGVYVGFIILVILLGTFILFFYLKKKSSSVTSRYPSVNCDEVINNSGSNLETQAFLDWYIHKESEA
jgi:hypothetical protein